MSKFSAPYYFLIRSRNAFPYLEKCLDSVFAQSRTDYKVLFVDDASEYTREQRNYIKQRLKGHIVQFNKEQQFSLKNAYDMIHTYVDNDQAVIINVDGDDWLLRNDVIDIVDATYKKNHCLLTYGNCLFYNPGSKEHLQKAEYVIEGVNQRYPKKVEKMNSYREYYFVPLHLRTWETGHFKKIPKKYFLRPNKQWIRICEDEAIFISMLETCESRYQVIHEPLYMYNVATPYNDRKINAQERLLDEVIILKKAPLVYKN